ncbi:MAG: hypothetical protein LQ338_002097 [Usnochroma carphineum]|nr:MAG: hypothetical protein LQ338_002097 [Usnochroma carphineum]
MASDWKPLHHLTTHPFIPPLLVKYEFGTSSYKVWITDLTSIWSEALDQRPLVQRAWDIETDIDPIESDQRQMLLQKIKASLDEVPGTKLALSRHDNSDSLQLTASSPLPKPFKTLQWPFHLALSPKMTLTTELVVPLLAEQLLFRKKVDSLLKILRDKDLVIGKLTDKMQSEGVEFEKIFPAAVAFKSSRKTISRDELGKSVKGLSAFDEAQWRMRCSADLDTPGTRQGLLLQVFAHGRSVSLSEIGEHPADERWWERVGAGNPLAHDGLEEISQSQSQTSVENEFQVHVKPYFLKLVLANCSD